MQGRTILLGAGPGGGTPTVTRAKRNRPAPRAAPLEEANTPPRRNKHAQPRPSGAHRQVGDAPQAPVCAVAHARPPTRFFSLVFAGDAPGGVADEGECGVGLLTVEGECAGCVCEAAWRVRLPAGDGAEPVCGD